MAKKKLSSKSNYVPNRMINEIEVERNGKTTYIDGANVLDGMYVKKNIKYAEGSNIAGLSTPKVGELVDTHYYYGWKIYSGSHPTIENAKEKIEKYKKQNTYDWNTKKTVNEHQNDEFIILEEKNKTTGKMEYVVAYREKDFSWKHNPTMKRVFGNGGGTAISSENGGYTIGTNADFNSNQYQPDVDLNFMKRGGSVGFVKNIWVYSKPMDKKIRFSVESMNSNSWIDTKSVVGMNKKEIEALKKQYDRYENVYIYEEVDKYAKGGGLKGTKYIPNYMVQSVEVERKGKTTDIDGADILDGFYVKKGVKFAKGGGISQKVDKIASKLKPVAVKHSGSPKDAYSVQIKDKTSGFTAWIDVWVDEQYNDVAWEWNKYIFNTDDASDVLHSALQDNIIVAEEMSSVAILYLEEKGLIHQDDNAKWHYTKKALGGFLLGVGVGVAGKYAYDKYGKKLQGKGTKKVASKGKKRKYEEGGKISNWGGTAESSQEGMLIGGTNAELTSNQYARGGGVADGYLYMYECKVSLLEKTVYGTKKANQIFQVWAESTEDARKICQKIIKDEYSKENRVEIKDIKKTKSKTLKNGVDLENITWERIKNTFGEGYNYKLFIDGYHPSIYIDKKWSAGDKWTINYFILGRKIEETFDSSEEAKDYAISVLKEQLKDKKVKNSLIKVITEYKKDRMYMEQGGLVYSEAQSSSDWSYSIGGL